MAIKFDVPKDDGITDVKLLLESNGGTRSEDGTTGIIDGVLAFNPLPESNGGTRSEDDGTTGDELLELIIAEG